MKYREGGGGDEGMVEFKQNTNIEYCLTSGYSQLVLNNSVFKPENNGNVARRRKRLTKINITNKIVVIEINLREKSA